jgi:hypothetical protein
MIHSQAQQADMLIAEAYQHLSDCLAALMQWHNVTVERCLAVHMHSVRA